MAYKFTGTFMHSITLGTQTADSKRTSMSSMPPVAAYRPVIKEGTSRRRCSVKMVECEWIALQLKLEKMQQHLARRQQRLAARGLTGEIALDGRSKAPDAVADIDFEQLALMTPRPVRRCTTVSTVEVMLAAEAEKGTDAAAFGWPGS